jgi:hypothetical protein
MTNPVEGYNMLIFERDDGSVTYTGSFNRAEWDAYLGKRGSKDEPAADEPAAEERSEQSTTRGRRGGGKKDD